MFVSYDLALQVKALGLIPFSIAVYISKTDEVKITDNPKEHYYLEDSAVTLQEILDWFMTKYGYYSDIFIDDNKTHGFMISYFTEDGRIDKPIKRGYSDIIEARLECIKELIQTVKEKQKS